ncbi:hypothetical protein MCP1_560013 [Candidatus Terasakiella magnetica]|nr:hypothetical protein MCP1_560013 [Candidatus Terasakiella magnetica]
MVGIGVLRLGIKDGTIKLLGLWQAAGLMVGDGLRQGVSHGHSWRIPWSRVCRCYR